MFYALRFCQTAQTDMQSKKNFTTGGEGLFGGGEPCAVAHA